MRWKPSTAGSPRTNAAQSSLPFLAIEWLARHAGEPSLFVYWRAYAEDHSDWSRAFETAFGLTPDAFYAAFERYRATLRNPGLPPPADDAAEPVITTSGTPSPAIVATVRTEVERLQSFYRDRFKAGGADYTVRIADGEMYEESARLVSEFVRSCRTRALLPTGSRGRARRELRRGERWPTCSRAITTPVLTPTVYYQHDAEAGWRAASGPIRATTTPR